MGRESSIHCRWQKSIIEEREQAEWKNDVVVNKGKGHHVICKSLMDLDTDELFIHVDTVLPKPRKKLYSQKMWGNYIMECVTI